MRRAFAGAPLRRQPSGGLRDLAFDIAATHEIEPGATRVTPLDFVSCPISHSLAA